MRMKKLLALLLALCMAFALVACGNDEPTNESKDPGSTASEGGEPTGEAVEITIAPFNIGDFTDIAAWDSLIAAFNEKYPNVTVKVTPVTYQDGDQQLNTLITGGNAPDIVFEGPERIIGNYAKEGLLVSLDDLWEGVTDVPESISSVSHLDGTYYMYPWRWPPTAWPSTTRPLRPPTPCSTSTRRPAPGPPTTS